MVIRDRGTIDNDAAWDWLDDFLHDPALHEIQHALETVAKADQDTPLDEIDFGSALAAAEMVAALNGRPNPELTDRLMGWITWQRKRSAVTPELLALARRAVGRHKGLDPTLFTGALDDLLIRLQQP